MGRLTYRNSTGRAFINHTYFNWEDGVAYKLAHYEDLEEQGLLIKLDLNQYKRDDLDRCTHRHCNNCDKYRRELQKYKDLEEQGRLIEVEYATIVGEAGNCSKCGESYMDVADADADQSRYIPNFCPWCGAIFVSEAKLKELEGE